MEKKEIKIYKKLLLTFFTKNFKNFIGMYFYGSRINNKDNNMSDLDIVLLFKTVNHEIRSRIYRHVIEIEYQYNIFFDIKTLSEEDLVNNPIFYEEIKKNGLYYGKKLRESNKKIIR